MQSSTIDQIGMVVVDAQQAAEALHRVFGLGPFRLIEWPIEGVDPEATYRGAPGSFRIRVAFAQVGPIQLELVEPVEGASIWSEFLESHGPGLHHVRIAAPDFDQAASVLEALGGPTVCSGSGFHVGSKWAYYDVSQILEGFVVEIRKSPDQSRGQGAWAAEGRQIGCSAT